MGGRHGDARLLGFGGDCKEGQMSYANETLDASPRQGMPRVHPAAELFPLMDGADLDALAEDIRLNGQVHPVVFYHGQLLDGRRAERDGSE